MFASTRSIILIFLLINCFSFTMTAQEQQPTIQQSAEVVEGYRVCHHFASVLAENLDFGAAFEAEYAKDTERRRAIVISDGEFGDLAYEKIDDASLVKAYKARMQIFFLSLILASPDRDDYFPATVMASMKKQPQLKAENFAAYADNLTREANKFRAHLDVLATKYPEVVERIRDFKDSLRKQSSEVPVSYKIEPKRNVYERGSLKKNEEYYEIDNFTLVREGNELKIVKISFFNRLF